MKEQSHFLERVRRLPVLGLGVSTEYGAADAPGALELAALRAQAPALGQFLEVGVELDKGLDPHALAWADAGLPTTYHFLDVNLDEPDEDLDPAWLAGVRAAATRLGAAWLCGDAGLWHFGPRGRGHMLLLPPILTPDSVSAMAEGIRRLRAATGLEVLPENPPGALFVGSMELPAFFSALAEAADTGLLIDCAHLAMYQRQQGRGPLDGLDSLALERVVELHVAGGTECTTADGFRFVEDDHSVTPLPETWALLEHILPRAPNLRAVVVECERNPLSACLPLLGRVHDLLRGTPLGAP